MTVEGEKKIAAKAAELMEAIKDELQAEKQEAVKFVHNVKDAALDAVEETKETLHGLVESAKKNMQEKTEELVLRKDNVVEDTAETLIKAIDNAKCALTRNKCAGDTADPVEAEGNETDKDSDFVSPV